MQTSGQNRLSTKSRQREIPDFTVQFFGATLSYVTNRPSLLNHCILQLRAIITPKTKL